MVITARLFFIEPDVWGDNGLALWAYLILDFAHLR